MLSDQDGAQKRHVVVLVHGIRTFGAWQDRLAEQLKEHEGSIEVVRYRYGYFSAIAFLLPFLRGIELHRFTRYLRKRADDWQEARVDLVAHSFGTYVVGWALRKLGTVSRLQFDTVILCGSVLKQSFPWDDIVGKEGILRQVVNDCGTKDVWPVMAQLFVPGMGLAGRHGFTGPTGPDVGITNRFFPIGHSDFFIHDFMGRHWVTLLTTDELPRGESLVPPTPRWHAAIEHYAEPGKLLLLLMPLVLALAGWLYLNLQIAEERLRVQEEESRRKIAEGLQARAQEQTIRAEAFRLVAEANRELFLAPQDSLLLASRAEDALLSDRAFAPRQDHDPMELAGSAQSRAFEVMQRRRQIKSEEVNQWYRGSWFNPSYFTGRLSARPNEDGSLALLVVARDVESDRPGDAYLLNNETLKLAKLEPREGIDEPLPLDYQSHAISYVGFASASKRIYLARRHQVQVYSTDGEFEGAFEFSTTTLSLTMVDDVNEGAAIVAGDTAGNLWFTKVDEELRSRPYRKSLTYGDVRVDSATNPIVHFGLSHSGRFAIVIQLVKEPDAPQVSEFRLGTQNRLRCLVWRAGAYQSPLQEITSPDSVLYAAFNPQIQESGGEQLVTTGEKGVIQFWTIKRSPKKDKLLNFDEKTVGFVTFSADGKEILAVADDGKAGIWNVESGRKIKEFSVNDGVSGTNKPRLMNRAEVPTNESHLQ